MSAKTNIENLFKSTSVNGLEVVIQSDGSYCFHLVVLKKIKNEIVIVSQHLSIPSIEGLIKLTDAKSPFVVAINGKGIIHKKTICKPEDSSKNLLSRVLPNANESDFCFQKNEIDETHCFISVIRANVLDEILIALKNNGIASICSCSLGPFVLTNSIYAINNTSAYFTIELNNFSIGVNDGRIAEINTTQGLSEQVDIKIGEDSINKDLVIAFSAALSYFTGLEKGILNSVLLSSLTQNFEQRQKFQNRAVVLLVATFTILLLNYVVFSYYWENNKELSKKIEMNNSSLAKVNILTEELNNKTTFLEKNGLLENSLTSFYADRLASNLPVSIIFTGLDIHPLKKKQANDESKLLTFETKLIRISGNCKQSIDLNDWMQSLKKYSWIEKTELIHYKQDNANDKGEFLIELQIK
jgi:Tfp pilus assembly protein PilN